MGTSGYYDEIAKVEALRRQRLWRLRKRRIDSISQAAKRAEGSTDGAGSASFQKRSPVRVRARGT